MNLYRLVNTEELVNEVDKFKEKLPDFLEKNEVQFLKLFNDGKVDEALWVAKKNIQPGYYYLIKEIDNHLKAIALIKNGESVYTDM